MRDLNDYELAVLKFTKNMNRLCKMYKNAQNACDKKCPLYKYKEEKRGPGASCKYNLFKNPKTVIPIVNDWATSNPDISYREYALRILPGIRLDKNNIPTVCAGHMFGFECEYVSAELTNCKECWLREMEG